jgi:hypothetical protein
VNHMQSTHGTDGSAARLPVATLAGTKPSRLMTERRVQDERAGCVVWHGDRVIDSRTALEAVVRHAVDLEDDYDDIAPVMEALRACGDVALVPRLRRFRRLLAIQTPRRPTGAKTSGLPRGTARRASDHARPADEAMVAAETRSRRK